MDESKENCILCFSSKSIQYFDKVPFCIDCFSIQKIKLNQYHENRTNFFPSLNKITEKIYLGNEDGQRDLKVLKDLGITHILICGSYLKTYHPGNFIYLQFEMDDSLEEDLSKFISKGLKFIEESEKIYVHCAGGISRSASMVISHLMWRNKLNYEDAYKIVKENRKEICPNPNFVKQLKDMEKVLFELNL